MFTLLKSFKKRYNSVTNRTTSKLDSPKDSPWQAVHQTENRKKFHNKNWKFFKKKIF
jgi:hypothetical protein